MRIRTIKPAFWASESISKLTRDARLLAIGLLNLADDEGYFKAHPLFIRAQLFPYDSDPLDITSCIQELIAIGFVRLRFVEGKNIGCVLNFTRHQVVKRSRASELKAIIEAAAPTPHPQVPHTSPTSTPHLTPGMEWNGKGMEREREGEAETLRMTAPLPCSKNKSKLQDLLAILSNEFSGRNDGASFTMTGRLKGQISHALEEHGFEEIVRRLKIFSHACDQGEFGAEVFEYGAFFSFFDRWVKAKAHPKSQAKKTDRASIWSKVSAEIRRVGAPGTPEKLPDNVRKAIGSMGGWGHICAQPMRAHDRLAGQLQEILEAQAGEAS